MTENDREDEIRRRYRELAREEPPRALDDAILAAARRELETRPAPLVAPSGRRRWAVPIAAAAVIVLSAVVTLHVQREQPDEELSSPRPAPPATHKDEKAAVASRAEVRQEKPAARASQTEPKTERKETAKPLAPERRRAQELAPARTATPSEAQATGQSAAAGVALSESALPKPPDGPGRFSPDPAPATSPPAQAPQMQMRPAAPAARPVPGGREEAGGPGAGAPVIGEERRAFGGARDSLLQREDVGSIAKRADRSEPPERLLERIATLRREGRQKEADDLYAEFRRRFPDYRIPEAMREQVVPR